MKRILVTLLACSAVISLHAGDHKVHLDPALRPYVQEWCDAMDAAGIPWREDFLKLNAIGVMTYSVDKAARAAGETDYQKGWVTINRAYMDRGYCAIRHAVFHEMGHAIFGLKHNSCFIMQTNAIPDLQYYCDGWDWMLKEYIKQCKISYYGR